MLRTLSAVVLLVFSLSSYVLGGSPHTDLSMTGTVIAVVSGMEVDVMVTRSAVPEVAVPGTVVRVVYHGIDAPDRFDRLYMETFDLNWKLTMEKEVYFDLAETAWDDEHRLHAYAYLDPSGYGMINAFLLASGLAEIDAEFDLCEPYASYLSGIAAIAKQSDLGIWADPDAPGDT